MYLYYVWSIFSWFQQLLVLDYSICIIHRSLVIEARGGDLSSFTISLSLSHIFPWSSSLSQLWLYFLDSSFSVFLSFFLSPLILILSEGPHWGILLFLNAYWHLALTSLSLAHAPSLFIWHCLIWPSSIVFLYALSSSLSLWLPSCWLSCLSFLILFSLLLCLSLISSIKCPVWVSLRVFVLMLYVHVRMCWKTNYI